MGLVVLTGCTATAPEPGNGPGRAGNTVTSAGSNQNPGDTRDSDRDVAAETLDAVADYWRQAYPTAFGTRWVELRGGLHPLDPGSTGDSALCISSPAQIAGNAYYCPAADGIVYDAGVLVPVLMHSYGRAGLTASLAHEFGHAVAARLGAPAEPLFRELQADCLAGAVLAALVPADAQVAALAPLLDFADQPEVAADAATAHGLAVDRAQAALLGLRSGPGACRDVGPDDIEAALGRFPAAPDRTARSLPAVDVSDADRLLAAPLGDAALAAADRLESVAGDDTARGCVVGRWMTELFGAVGPDAVGGRLTDPDEALNFLRARPDASPALVFGYLDGLARRC